MSLQASTRATIYTRVLIFMLLTTFLSNAFAQWRVDFSRRVKPAKGQPSQEESANVQTPKVETVDVSEKDETAKPVTQLPTKATSSEWTDVPIVDATKKAVPVIKDTNPVEGVQELVVLNTEKGFVPSALRLRQGSHYRLYVVNINEKEKNLSFVLDAFAENHGTFFGQPKVIELYPQRDGVFQFQCPETATQGRLVVLPNNSGEDSNRQPAAKDNW